MAIQDLTANLDLKQNLNIYARCKQFDSLNLILSIYDNSIAADLTNYNVRLKAMKADQIPLIQEHIGITIVGNDVTIEADEQLTTTSGKTLVELQFINKTTGKKKATFNLVLIIVPSTIEVNATISTATYTLLQELENKLDQCLDFFENIDEAVIANTNLVNSTNTANSTKEALDNSNTTALATKSALDTSNTNATDTKEALDLSITNSNVSKEALDTSKTNADASKVALDSSVEAANNFATAHQDIENLVNQVNSNTSQLSQKANNTDSNRTTSDKTVTGAINELNINKANKTEVNSLATNKADLIAVNALQTQVNSLASDTPKGSYDTLALLQTAFPTGTTGKYIIGASAEVKHWYIWNGSAWIDGGVYQGNGIADKSVELKHMKYYMNPSFLDGITQTLVNLINLSTTQNLILGSNGTTGASSTYFLTDYISINPLKKYYRLIATDVCLIATYDSNKTFIERLSIAAGVSEFSFNSNVAYIKYNDTIASKNIQVFCYDIVPTSFVAYNPLKQFVMSNDYILPNNFMDRGISTGLDLNTLTADGMHCVVNCTNQPFTGTGFLFNRGINSGGVKRWVIQTLYDYFNPTITYTRTIDLLTPANNTNWVKANQLSGLTWSFFGDSITYGVGCSAGYDYPSLISKLYGIKKYNNAIGGARWQKTVDGIYDNISILTQVTNAQSTIAVSDVVTILAGTNDWGNALPLGTITDTTELTLYGAINTVLTNILTYNPSVKIVVFTPFYRERQSPGDGKNSDDYTYAGNYLSTYIDAIITACKHNHVKCINLNEEFSVNKINSTTMLSDGLHLSDLGSTQLAKLIHGKVMELF